MKEKVETYTAEKIKILDGLAAVRKRPAMPLPARLLGWIMAVKRVTTPGILQKPGVVLLC
jgi:hypothetical protein